MNIGVYAIDAPETTVDAALSIDTGSQLDRTLAAIAARGAEGVTGPDIADEVGLSVSLVSTRIKTLHIRGLVGFLRDDGQPVTRRSVHSGRTARVHVATSW